MLEVAVTFILDGVPLLVKRIAHPPAVGDEYTFNSGVVGKVTRRVWRISNVENQAIDVHLKRVKKP